uniref:Peptidase M12B domain-containing protein n=1 Tax=Meleagris gallopavo TaxID=9103 RepID=A0A803YDC3_MELGA
MVRLHCFQRDCFYEGYVEGFPGSLVALSTCSGLSGILQLANTSYGIKPLEAASGYQHLVYQMEGENDFCCCLICFVLLKAKEAVPRSPRYLEMHVILDKALYDYMGADKYVVTTKMVQLFSYMFTRLNLTIVLTSLEFWTEKNKIPTTGAAEELLQRFLEWKSTHRTSRLQDITFLFVYREQSHSMGASSARKLCLKDRAGGVALVWSPVSMRVALCLGTALGCAHPEGEGCWQQGLLCWVLSCGVGALGWQCPTADECELKEYCNGTSGECAPNLWVMDGHPCRQNTAFCYRGVCQTADKQCQEIFGKDAKNGPLACYEEVNGQRDRMGHCGSDHSGYHSCAWSDLRCGKLICEYLGTVPFTKERAAVVYVRMQNVLCVTLDYMQPRTERDPMLVRDGSVCDDRKVNVRMCSWSADRNHFSPSVTQVCDSKGDCHCDVGWKPPDCREKAESQGGPSGGEQGGSLKTWQLLTLCLSVPILIGLIFVVIKRKELKQCLSTEQPQEEK